VPNKTIISDFPHAERGVVLLEVALVLSVLILLASSVIDVGMALSEQTKMLDAARSAARQAARYHAATVFPDEEDEEAVRIGALNMATTALESSGLRPSNYFINVRSTRLNLPSAATPAVEVNISRHASNRFRISTHLGFGSCVTAFFRQQDKVSPREFIVDTACGGD
jgi:Flp pilus assembly protein TadG